MEIDPLNFDWDEIAKELREKLGREPKTIEVQVELLRKFWDSIDIIEKNDKA